MFGLTVKAVVSKHCIPNILHAYFTSPNKAIIMTLQASGFFTSKNMSSDKFTQMEKIV